MHIGPSNNPAQPNYHRERALNNHEHRLDAYPGVRDGEAVIPLSLGSIYSKYLLACDWKLLRGKERQAGTRSEIGQGYHFQETNKVQQVSVVHQTSLVLVRHQTSLLQVLEEKFDGLAHQTLGPYASDHFPNISEAHQSDPSTQIRKITLLQLCAFVLCALMCFSLFLSFIGVQAPINLCMTSKRL